MNDELEDFTPAPTNTHGYTVPQPIECPRCKKLFLPPGIHTCVQPQLSLTPRQRGIIHIASVKARMSEEAFLERVIDVVADTYITTGKALEFAIQAAIEEAEKPQ